MKTELDYVARCLECNRLVGWTMRTDDSKTISGWIKDGLSVERMSTEDAKQADWGHRGCKHDKRSPDRQLKLSVLRG